MLEKLKTKQFWGIVFTAIGGVLAGATEPVQGILHVISSFFGA